MTLDPITHGKAGSVQAFARIERGIAYEANTGCWLSPLSGPHGYTQVRLNKRRWLGHRASWEAHRGSIPPGLHVCHRCDTPACVNPDHLFLGTHAQNMADMKTKGRAKSSPDLRGEKIAQSLLAEASVRAIRRDAAAGASPADLATRHGVTRAAIYDVVNRRTWRHVQ